MKTTVIHHSADFDGIFCREIARKFLPDATLIGWDYGDPHLEFPKEGQVYVLDLSPDCFWESPLRAEFIGRLIWIDHHRSAIEKYDGTGWTHEPAGKDSFGVSYNEFWRKEHETRTTAPSPAIAGYRIDGVAACRLAWQWFCNSMTAYGKCKPENFGPGAYISGLEKKHFADRLLDEPVAVRLAGEYDIFDRRDPRAELFQFGLRSQELTFLDWDLLLAANSGEDYNRWHNSQSFVTRLLEQGTALQYARDQEYRNVITSQGFDLQWEGLTFLACNSHECDIRSQLFEAGIKPHHDALIGFTFHGKGWRVSLYQIPGKEDRDILSIAKRHGGGGHCGACGFQPKTLPFSL